MAMATDEYSLADSWQLFDAPRPPQLELCEAAEQNDVEALQECLKKKGVDVNKFVRIGFLAGPALTLAVHRIRPEVKPDSPEEAKQLQTIRLLIEHKANPNTHGESGDRALHFAETPNVAEALLEAKANIDAVSDSCWTALMCATSNGRAEVVRVLLEHGAKTKIKNKDRKTALDVGDDNKAEVKQCKELIRAHIAKQRAFQQGHARPAGGKKDEVNLEPASAAKKAETKRASTNVAAPSHETVAVAPTECGIDESDDQSYDDTPIFVAPDPTEFLRQYKDSTFAQAAREHVRQKSTMSPLLQVTAPQGAASASSKQTAAVSSAAPSTAGASVAAAPAATAPTTATTGAVVSSGTIGGAGGSRSTAKFSMRPQLLRAMRGQDEAMRNLSRRNQDKE